jgi:hypothetical protein
LQPGSHIALDLTPALWRVEQSTIDGYVVVVELRPHWTAGASIAADPGRIVANPDEPVSDLTLGLFDVPDVLDQGSATPALLIAASSSSSVWQSRTVEIAAGQQVIQCQTASRKSVLGHATAAPGAGDPYLINEAGAFEVQLIDANQWLVSCDDDALVGGANLAVLGSEVLQFGRAEPLGEGRFRLSRLVRGRAGTEWAMSGHSVGEAFVLIERDALRGVALPTWAIGGDVSASALNLSGTSSAASVVLSGESLRPLAPVDLQTASDAGGNLAITWTRRSRSGFAWIDGIDAPLGEASEAYRVTINGPAGTLDLPTSQPALNVSAADMAALGSGAATIQVRQIGEVAASRPAEITLTI